MKTGEASLAFLAWLKAPTTLPADLRAKWHELQCIGWPNDEWKIIAIERELRARGEHL